MTEADDKPYGEDGVGASVLNEVVDWTVLIRGTGVPGVYMRTNALVRKKLTKSFADYQYSRRPQLGEKFREGSAYEIKLSPSCNVKY